MCGEGFIEGGRVGKAYVKPFGTPWREVSFTDSNGLAIFEGCIILGETAAVEASHTGLRKQIQSMPNLLTDKSIETRGAGIVGAQFRWKERTVPYLIDPGLPEPDRVMNAIAHWHARTTIRFVERTDQPDFVRIVQDDRGCASRVGRQGGMQDLILGDFCTVGNIIHELGHTVGFWHEQCRTDRDRFVRINFDNVQPANAHNFEQSIVETIDLAAYDYGSIMHYPPNAFGVTRTSMTIEPLKPVPPGVVIGQREALSDGDVAAVEALYAGVPQAHV